MSPLSVLCLILPFPLLFIVHELEEITVFRRWIIRGAPSLSARFPRMEPLLSHLSTFTTGAFCIAAAEELLLLLGVTGYVLIDGPQCLRVWATVFLAFVLHQAGHVVQAIIVRSYVPGLPTAILLLPYTGYTLFCLHLVLYPSELLLLTLAGAVLLVLNLIFAHWLGKSIA